MSCLAKCKNGAHGNENLTTIFGILVALTKNELTKICNEPGIDELNIVLQMISR